MSVHQSRFKRRRFKCTWSTQYRRCRGCSAVLMPRCAVTCKVRLVVSRPIFHLQLRFSKLSLECRRSLVNAALTSVCVPVSAPSTRTALAYSKTTQRESITGEIAKRGAVDWHHIPSGQYTVDNTCRGRQRTGHLEVRRVPSWRGNLNKREIRPFPVRGDTRFELEIRTLSCARYKNGFQVDSKCSMWVPGVIADAIPVGSDLMWVNERPVQCITKPQYLVSNKDNESTTEGASLYRCTLRNPNVGFRLIICRETGDNTRQRVRGDANSGRHRVCRHGY